MKGVIRKNAHDIDLIPGVKAALQCLFLICLVSGAAANGGKGPGRMEAESAVLSDDRVHILSDKRLVGEKGVALRPEAVSRIGSADAPENPDLVFRFTLPEAGTYVLSTHSTLNAQGLELAGKASKVSDSLMMRFQYGDFPAKERVVAQIWRRHGEYNSKLGLFVFPKAGPQELKIWLPRGVVLDWLSVVPFRGPAVPKEARNYQPPIVPPAHPRLFVNPQTLPELRQRVMRGENLPVWQKVEAVAKKPCGIVLPPGEGEINGNAALEDVISQKAFYYLIAGDEAAGREAVALILPYMRRVAFGNMLDITRQVGAAIYTASLVYDWCYPLLTPGDRDSLRADMLRLAETMECSWPPFGQNILNGHGNEAQINRDLLSMSIAVYDEDPVPYRYCSYLVLEKLVPMRRFEYQSPRHSQGISYGAYRLGWELQAKILMERMAGMPVFDPNVNQVYKFWLYMRAPSGFMLRDGDGSSWSPYWNSRQAMLLFTAISSSPVMKGELMRQNPGLLNRVLYLLLNDPDLKPEPSLESLPLTIDFGHVIGGMVARTGWRMDKDSNDAVVSVKGGGYHMGNHDHADAGDFQVYFRGPIITPLGIYKYYGTTYDYNFAKRSGSRSMLLVVDPNEKFLNTEANDGGSRFNQRLPRNLEDLLKMQVFRYGTVLSCSFGPSEHRPTFSIFSANLAQAYSKKVKELVRTLCVLNLGNEKHPAVVLVHDRLEVSNPAFRKYWQVTTLRPPELTENGAILSSYTRGQLKPVLPRPFAYPVKTPEPVGKLDLQMLIPKASERTLQVFSGEDADSVFGKRYEPRMLTPEAKAYRLMFSPKKDSAEEEFFAVMRLYAEDEKNPLPMQVQELPEVLVTCVADRVVILKRNVSFLSRRLEITLPESKGPRQIMIYGLKPGQWRIAPEGEMPLMLSVKEGQNTAFFTSGASHFRISPED